MPTPTRPRRWSRLVALAGAAALTAPVAGAAAVPADAATTTTANRPATVLLPTGERLTVRWNGDRPLLGRQPGDRTRFTVVTTGGRTYAVPAEAMPYLDRTLDRSMFDVAALAAAEGPAGRVPLAVTGDAAVPGARGTGSSRWLDAAGAAAFGAALRDRIRRDPAGARTGAAVPGLTRLALAGAPSSAPSVHPDFPMYTLTVTLTPPTGQTVRDAAVLIVNTDDSRAYESFTGLVGNLAKVSVPAGHYALVGSVDTVTPDGDPGTVYLPVTTDYQVTGAGQSVHLDADQATAESTYSTPEATTLDSITMDLDPTDGVHQFGLGILYSAEDQVLVQPTAKPASGVLEFDTVEHRLDAAGEDWYLTAEWTAGIPADLHRTVRTQDIATVTDQVYADGATGDSSFGLGPVYPDLRGVGFGGPPVPATSHTSYLYGPPDVRWVGQVGRNTDAGGSDGEGMFGTPQDYPPGRSYRADWFRGTLAPGFQSTVTFPRPYCVACRTSDQLALILPSEVDGVAGHNGWLGGGTTGWGHLRVFQDGALVADAADTDNITFPVPADRHGYRIESTVDRSAFGLTRATRTSAVYTVDSSAGSGAALPDGWYCQAPGTGACTILPLLTTTVPLPVRTDGTLPAGATSFTVTVGHLPAATASAVTALTVDTAVGTGGYTPARVHPLGGGRYRVTLVLPGSATGQPVALRVHAEDAAGGTLTQTVSAAATIAR